jgi:hypothetical protein
MIGPSWRVARKSAPIAGCAPAWADSKFLAQVTNPKAVVSARKLLNGLHRSQIPRPDRYAKRCKLV